MICKGEQGRRGGEELLVHASHPARHRLGRFARYPANASWMLLALTIGLAGAAPAHGDDLIPTESARALVADTVVDIVPAPLEAWLAAHRDELRDAVCGRRPDPDAGQAAPRAPRLSAEDWYVQLDAAAGNSDEADRAAATRAFPWEQSAAEALYRSRGVRAGGRLPWTLLDRQARLATAFRDGDQRAALGCVAQVVQLATAAGLPGHATADHTGQHTGNLQLSAAAGLATAGHRDVHARLEEQVLTQLGPRLAVEVRVWPDRVRACPVPSKAVFDTLLASHARWAQLAEIDRAALAALGVQDAAGFVASAEAYYARVREEAAPVLEERLEAGALLAARLIVTAWREAGAPDWAQPGSANAQQDQPPAGSARSAEPVDADDEAPFVASRSSKIYHRSTCSHALRIRPENRVTFPTAEAAEASGRSPCKTCKPGQPDDPETTD